ncbi:MAG: hypothetical protein GY872_05885, partial [Roseibacillus sp.]|nr:hypothetical protein [Roseibacillus sp.]
YHLELVPGEPTKYYFDGSPTDMESQDYSVEVLSDDGTVGTVERTLWRTRYGPILNIDSFAWTSQYAFSMRDANAGNRELVAQFTAMNRATGIARKKWTPKVMLPGQLRVDGPPRRRPG